MFVLQGMQSDVVEVLIILMQDACGRLQIQSSFIYILWGSELCLQKFKCLTSPTGPVLLPEALH